MFRRLMSSRNTPLFDADTGGGSGTPAAPTPVTPVDTGTPTAPAPVFTPGSRPVDGHPLLADVKPVAANDGQVIDGETKPVEQPSQPMSVLDKLKAQGITKFNDEDAFIKSYSEIEKMNTRTSQTNAQLMQEINQQKGIIEALMKQINQPAQQTQTQQQIPHQPTPEDIAAENDKLTELMLNNPSEFRKQVLEEAKKTVLSELNPVIAPVIEEYRSAQRQKDWNLKAADFRNAVDESGQLLRPDFDELTDYMNQALQNNPDIATLPNVLDVLYGIAKGMKASSAPPVIDPKTMLKDQQFLTENVFNNPEIQKVILENHLKSLSNGAPPPVIGGQGGAGQPTVVPENEPKNIKESGSLFRKALQATGLI